jgi:hypothetical protein
MKIRNLLFPILMNFIMLPSSYSQASDSLLIKRNSVFIEFLGMSGSAVSINYDRVLKEVDNSTIDLNLGFGYFPGAKGWNSIIGIPLYLNFSTGHSKHHFEFGLGLTYNTGIIQESYIGLWNRPSVVKSISQEALFASFKLGYKYQKPGGGLFLRVGFTPLFKIANFSQFDSNVSIYPLFGAGAGFTF